MSSLNIQPKKKKKPKLWKNYLVQSRQQWPLIFPYNKKKKIHIFKLLFILFLKWYWLYSTKQKLDTSGPSPSLF